jgi:DNA-binding PadR family transcriptional regulator
MEDQIVEDLTLLLLHLTSWEERIHKELTIHRAWKGFRFEALDALEEAGYLNQSRGAKSVTLTEAGIERARALAARYLGEAAESQ